MIRKATPQDSDAVSRLLIEPMKSLALLITGAEDVEDARKIMEDFFCSTSNQYSFENTLVAIEDDVIAGSVTGYDGAELSRLRTPVIDFIRAQGRNIDLPEETETGEYYIDTICVNPAFRGRGIGKQLIEAICELAISNGHQQIGLIVDPENPGARRLYEKLGFVVESTRDFIGKPYLHMIRQIGDSAYPSVSV